MPLRKTISVAAIAAALFASPTAAAYYEEDPRATECRLSVINAKSVPGPGTDYEFPTDCGLVLPFANLYNKAETVIGEFKASSCGECASACVAQAGVVPGEEGFPQFWIQTSIPGQQANFDAILASGQGSCTDWVWCDPWQVNTQGGCPDGPTNQTDPFTGDCVGRWRDGELESFAGYGNHLYLQGSQQGCKLSSGTVVPPGTCTLKEIVSSKWKDHVYNASEDPRTTPLMSGMCDWTLKG